jgi:hypothetical protein
MVSVSYLAKSKPLIGYELESALRKSKAINSALVSRKTLLPTTLVFHSPEKVAECFVNSIADILSNLTMNSRIFAFDELVIIKLSQSLARSLVSAYAHLKKLIIDCLANLQRTYQPFSLFARRIQPELIHQQAHRRIAIC